MALKDLISRVRESRIGKAVANLDRDKQSPGFQLLSQRTRQNLQSFNQAGSKYNPVQVIGRGIAKSATSAGDAMAQRQDLINQRTQGLSFRDRLFRAPQQDENTLLTQGLQKSTETIGSIIAPKHIPATIASAGIGYAGTKLTGGTNQEALSNAISAGKSDPVYSAIAGITNPYVSKLVPSGAGVLSSRVAPATANVIQGVGIDIATGQKTTPTSLAVDALVGLAGGKGQFSGASSQSYENILKKGEALGIKGVSPRVNNVHPEDLDVMREFADNILRGGKSKQPLGELGVSAQRLAQHYFGGNWAAADNKKLAKAFEWAIDLNMNIPREARGQLPKLGIMGGQEKPAVAVKPKLTPEVENVITQARKEIGTIADEKPTSIGKIAQDLYTQWVDRFTPVINASRRVKKELGKVKATLRPENDPEYLVRRLTGASGIASERYNTVLKPILDEMNNLKIDKTDMDVYLKAKRDIGLGRRGILGSDTNLASQRVTALMEKYPGIDGLAQKLYSYQNQGFQEMIDAGFLSKDAADLIRRENPDYVPFQRVMDELDNYLGLPSVKLQQGTSPIQKIKGSERQIYSPIESVIANTFKQRAAIEKNRVASSIVGLQELSPDLGFQKVAKSSPETITVWRNGQKEFWKVGSDIADTVKGLDEESANTLLKIFRAPASWLRQGATGRNPDFLIPNIIKDQIDAGISSKYGYVPFLDYFSGLKSMLGNDEIYQKWANSGAKIDLGEISGRTSIKESFDQATKRKGLFSWIGKGLDTLGKYSEVPTRVGLFKKAYQKTGNELIAAMESRDATVDFARMGSKMKVANSIIPFLNVGIQGFDKIIRQAKNNPGKLALQAGVYAALPAIATAVYNLKNHPEEYAEIPQYVKDSNFVLVGGRNDDGTVNYYTIPKGNIAPLITNPIENFIAYAAGQNSQTLDQFATQFISSALPVVGDGSSIKEVATKTIGQNLPQLVKPPIEGLLNRSFYKFDPNKQESKQIVPDYLKKEEPYQQAYDWTPKTYKAIGAALNVSPLWVQHYLESYLAGYTKVPSQIVGILDNISRGESVRKNDIPILRRFMSTTFESSGGQNTVEKPETTPFLERIMGKVSAKEIDLNQPITTKTRDKIRDKIKYGKKVSESELVAAYIQPSIQMPKSNRYEKSLRESKLFSDYGSITKNENLSDAQKRVLYNKIASELGRPTRDLELYQVANQDNNTKTLYSYDQIDTLKKPDDLIRFLVQNRRPINGQIIMSDGVITNLVNDGIIPEDLGKELKALDLNEDGTIKKKPEKKKKKKGAGISKVRSSTNKYYTNLSKVGSASFKAPKVDVKAVTLGG